MRHSTKVPAMLFAVVLALSAASTAVAASELVQMTEDAEPEQTISYDDNLWDMSAGVAAFMNPSPVASSDEETRTALENAEKLNGASDEETTPEVGIVMSDADFTLDIVADRDEEAEVIGYLYEDCGGHILEQEDGWTLLQSGDLIGWTKDENLAFGDKAVEMAKEAGQSIVVVTAPALRARTAPEDGAEVVALLARGEELDYIEDASEDWVAVDFNNEVVYVAAAFVEKDFSIDTGETVKAIEKREEAKRIEEERKAEEEARLEEEEAKKKEEERKAAEEALQKAEEAALLAQAKADEEAAAQVQSAAVNAVEASVPSETTVTESETAQLLEAQAAMEAAQRAAATQAAAAAATPDDVRLLGALIYCEAGNQSYEGKVAVGAVVMNRVKSGTYPNTIDGVIRASGQFTPVRSGKVDRVYASGVPEECMRAAQEALAGVSPVGDVTHFRRNNGRAGQVIGAHVFY